MKLGALDINFDHVRGFLSIKNIDLGMCNFSGTVDKDAELLMTDVKYHRLSINKLFNNGKIRLFDLNPNQSPESSGSIFMLGSNLGKTDFFNVNMASGIDLVISNCYFIDCTFVNVLWPIKLNIFALSGSDTNWLDVKEMYRQLKYAYSKQGDSVLEHQFHSLEMDAYRTYLKEERRAIKKSGKFDRWKRNRQTSIILLLSSCTSEYGQSFTRPICTLLLTGLFLFCIIVPLGGIKELYSGFHFSIRWNDVSSTIGHYFNFLNPLRKYDTQEINVTLLIDFLMRIIASYCIYNFIRATRRFVK
jgi:hypothetical protein